jgi:hypothetical protein
MTAPLQTTIRGAVNPVVAKLIAQLGPPANVTRPTATGERSAKDNRLLVVDLPVANGTARPVIITQVTRQTILRQFGEDLKSTAQGVISDICAVLGGDKVMPVSGPFAGWTFLVDRTKPVYEGGLILMALTRIG